MKSFIKEILYRIRGDFTTRKLITMGLEVGVNFKRLHGVIIDPGHCWLIKIGDDVTIAPRVHILAHDASTKFYLNYTKIGRVWIGDRVFIGAESVILPNVRIGDDVIIGANSTVTKDIPTNSVVAGNPAKYICNTNDYIAKMNKQQDNSIVFDETYTLRKNINDEMKNEMKSKLKNKIGFVK